MIAEKRVNVYRLTESPLLPELGAGDKAEVFFSGNDQVYTCPCRSWPNPYRPSDRILYLYAYGCLAPCITRGKVKENAQWGVHIQLNNLNFLPSTIPNMNNGNQMLIKKVCVHPMSEEQPGWPGSAGCITIPKIFAPQFFSLFVIDEGIIFQLFNNCKEAA